MLSKRFMTGSLVLLIGLTALARGPQASMKGYELYSWQRDGEWYFSVLPGTNRLKTYEEITSEKVARKGRKAIKAELEKIPKGEEVFWRSGDHPGVGKPAADTAPKLELPQGRLVRKIKRNCDKLGLKLTLL